MISPTWKKGRSRSAMKAGMGPAAGSGKGSHRLLPAALLVGASALWAPAAAQTACPGSYAHRDTINLADLVSDAGKPAGFSNIWGREHVSAVPGEAPARTAAIRVRYPQGSVNPGNPTLPSGGAGFLYRLKDEAARACLSYQVRFPASFDFVRGGKLPGLFGGQAPRGCSARELSEGFSARLMWRKSGEGELYLYSPDRTARCGDSVRAKAWSFPIGRWVTIQQQIELAQDHAAGDTVRIWMDGALLLERKDLRLRETSRVGIGGLLFSTFFGGSDASWASPVDQYADFTDFTIRWSAVPRARTGTRS